MPYNIHYLHLLGHWMRMAGVVSTKRTGRQGPGALQQLKPYIQSWCCWLLENWSKSHFETLAYWRSLWHKNLVRPPCPSEILPWLFHLGHLLGQGLPCKLEIYRNTSSHPRCWAETQGVQKTLVTSYYANWIKLVIWDPLLRRILYLYSQKMGQSFSESWSEELGSINLHMDPYGPIH